MMEKSNRRNVSLALVLGAVVVVALILVAGTGSEQGRDMVDRAVALVTGDAAQDIEMESTTKLVTAEDMEEHVRQQLKGNALAAATTEDEAREILKKEVEKDGEDESLVDDLVAEWAASKAEVAADSRSRYFYNKGHPAVGGGGGRAFTLARRGQVITQVCVRSGSLIDAIRVRFSDGRLSGFAGGRGGRLNCFQPSGRCISSVFVKAGSKIDGLLFVDKDGSISPYYGGYGGSGTAMSNDGNRCLYKIVGRTGKYVRSLRFFFRKLPAPPKPPLRCSGPNVALRRPTGQSSIGWGGASSRAVDGNRNQNYGGRSCTHTALQNRPTFFVNIGRQNAVCAVRIYNRRDCCAGRLSNFAVFVTNRAVTPGFVPSRGEICATYKSKAIINVRTLKCRRPLRGQNVGVQINGKQYLTICEFQVFTLGRALPQPRCKSRKNIALRKPTGQINTGWGGLSGRAVDGNVNGNYGGKSCTHTQLANNPYLYVDLKGVRPVCGVRIFNRQDCCAERLRNFKIFVTNRKPTGNFVARGNEICAYDGSQVSFRVKYLTCVGRKRGRYVGVQIAGRQYLTVCELQVFSY